MKLRLHFLGANRQVTGSRYCLEVRDRRLLIDCGMFQEREFKGRNWEPCPLPPASIDAIVLTHAHIDHCGLVPRLVREGFKGPIFVTEPTADLLEVMWEDAAKIQLEDVKYKLKRHRKEGKKSPYGYDPLYDEDDVAGSLSMVKPTAYFSPTEVLQDVVVTFHDAGHILGSSSVEVRVKQGNESTRIIFSGDIGQWGKPILRDPTLFAQGDYVVMESTYGDRDHREAGDIESQLSDVINNTVARSGKVVIPTFAVERAQELIYHIATLTRENRIPAIPIFLDSPMAADVTDIFRRHRRAFDAEAWQLISAGTPPLRVDGLVFSRSAEESKAINEVEGPAVIMSTSGMCTAGRIKHHLRRNISDARATILFVGYQGHGTLGRQILEKREKVRIHGRQHEVKSQVSQIYGFSGHADRTGLLRWQGSFRRPPRCLFLTHGEEDAALSLAQEIRKQAWDVVGPEYQASVPLM